MAINERDREHVTQRATNVYVNDVGSSELKWDFPQRGPTKSKTTTKPGSGNFKSVVKTLIWKSLCPITFFQSSLKQKIEVWFPKMGNFFCRDEP